MSQRNRPGAQTFASLCLLFLLLLAGCSAVVTDDQAPGTYKADPDWGSSTIVLSKDHTFHQTVTLKNGRSKEVSGTWRISRNSSDVTYTTISLSPFFSVTHDKQGFPTLASAYSIYHVPFGGINIAADPDYGIAFRKIVRAIPARDAYDLHQENALPTSAHIPSKQARNVVRSHILFTFGVALALALAWRLREVLLLIYISALFAVVLLPVVKGIMDFEVRSGRRISRITAIILLLTAVFLALGLFFTFALPPVIRDIHQFANDLPGRIPGIEARVKHIPLPGSDGMATQLAQKAESALSATAEYLFASFPDWMGRIFDLLTAFILCVYFMLEGSSAYQWFMSLFPVEQRLRLAVTLQKAERRMSKWLVGQGLLMLILGTCSTIVFGLLHVRYFFLLGVLMGLMNIIPIAGGVITILLVAAVAALDSWTKMALVFLFYVIYVNIENAYLTPRIMRQSVNLMGLTVLIALIVGTELAGIAGALVAVPTAALIAVLMEEYLVQKDPV